MSDRVLFISWGSPIPGREERGLEVFNEAIGLHGRLQQDGRARASTSSCSEPTAAASMATSR